MHTPPALTMRPSRSGNQPARRYAVLTWDSQPSAKCALSEGLAPAVQRGKTIGQLIEESLQFHGIKGARGTTPPHRRQR